jgi:hypothetical protein
MQQRKRDRNRRQWGPILVGVIISIVVLTGLLLLEDWLGLKTRWLGGANVVLAILVFNIVVRAGRKK